MLSYNSRLVENLDKPIFRRHSGKINKSLIQSRLLEDPLAEVQCPEATDVHKAQFQADTDLMDFLTSSTLSLSTTEGQDDDSQQRNNICNSARTVDIVTLYMAKALGLSTANIINNFVYDVNETYVFPMNNSNGPSQIYPPPSNSYYFPSLDRSYWTILSHYTTTTEHTLRAGKSGKQTLTLTSINILS